MMQNRLCRLMPVLACAAAAGALGACSMIPPHPGDDPHYLAAAPIAPGQIGPSNGAIYEASQVTPLFADVRARHVGDSLTVIMDENTAAKKSADTDTSGSTDVGIDGPTVFGRGITHNGVPILQTQLSSDKKFSGAGDTSQSNQLTGSITVTVAQVLANGNLIVQGEKWITINQGHEYIRLRGIVRPEDIRSDNSVLSSQLANARIAYGGTGLIDDANRPGWLTRFFQSALWPL